MEYRLLPDPEQIRRLFMEQFVESYEEFCEQHKSWIAGLHFAFDEDYYDSMFMWDRKVGPARPISFPDALASLKEKKGDVLFLTESPRCPVRDFSRLNNRDVFAASAVPKDLAACIADEWYTEYELSEQGCYLADPILPSDVYVFDESFSWCLIYTHETDETEDPESRFCLLIDKNAEEAER